MPSNRRKFGTALQRGVRGRCPACGQGALLKGYINPIPCCAKCGEDLAPYQTADFAPYLVTFLIGLIFMPLTLGLTFAGVLHDWMLIPLFASALAIAALALPRAKGAAIGLLWALDVKS